jgi:hypothetical protein
MTPGTRQHRGVWHEGLHPAKSNGVDGRPGAVRLRRPHTPNLDDEVRRIDEMNRMIQADSDAMNAAIQAREAGQVRNECLR